MPLLDIVKTLKGSDIAIIHSGMYFFCFVSVKLPKKSPAFNLFDVNLSVK